MVAKVGLHSHATQPDNDASIILPIASECAFCHCAPFGCYIGLIGKQIKEACLLQIQVLILAFWRRLILSLPGYNVLGNALALPEQCWSVTGERWFRLSNYLAYL